MKENEIQAVRDFNRFYTNVIGLLDDSVYNTTFSLPEARVLYEMYHRQPCTATILMENIQIDKGYLSRILASFIRKGMLTRKSNPADRRATLLTLSARGNQEFDKINRASMNEIRALLDPISPQDKKRLLRHMTGIRNILRKNIKS